VFWPDLNIHIILYVAIYCEYIWYILRTTDFLYWGYTIPVSAEAHCTILCTVPLFFFSQPLGITYWGRLLLER
jgi:hypothetical protein